MSDSPGETAPSGVGARHGDDDARETVPDADARPAGAGGEAVAAPEPVPSLQEPALSEGTGAAPGGGTAAQDALAVPHPGTPPPPATAPPEPVPPAQEQAGAAVEPEAGPAAAVPPPGAGPGQAPPPAAEVEAPADDQRPEPEGGRRRVPKWPLVAFAAAGVALLVAAFVLARSTNEAGEKLSDRPVATTAPRTTVPADFATFQDPETGTTLRHPREWRRIDSPDPGVRLLLHAGAQNSVLVRVIPVETPITPQNLGNMRAVADAIVSAPGTRVLNQRDITLNGMPGFHYLYTFNDPPSGLDGVHSHYFLFQGRKMNMLVFQALPVEDFARLAPVFDQIAETFQSDPAVDPPATTVVPSTTAPASTPTTTR